MDLKLTFDSVYVEQSTLSSGENVRFRLVRPTDKAHLRRGFARLSPASRRKRFLATKEVLSDAEVRYYTELDQFDHVAIGALCLNAEGEESEGAGIARFVRFPNDRKCAEVAIAVIDHLQGKGIGSFLLRRLAAAAMERDVEWFRFDCLPYNLEIQRLLRTVCGSVAMVNEEGLLVAEANLAESFSDSNQGFRDAAA